jgi:hypothetical protein
MFSWFTKKPKSIEDKNGIRATPENLPSPIEEKVSAQREREPPLTEIEYDTLANAIFVCIPASLRSSLHFEKFELSKQPDWDEDRASQISGLNLVMHSVYIFESCMEQSNPFEHLPGDWEETARQTLLNYIALSDSDKAFGKIFNRFKKKRRTPTNFKKLGPKVFDLIKLMRERDDSVISALVADHKNTLVPTVLRLISLGTNKYGRTNDSTAITEIGDFWASVPGLSEILTYPPEVVPDITLTHILKSYGSIGSEELAPKNGLAFEIWCSEKMTATGLDNHLTEGGGDQGIDIIFTVGEKRFGVQCKRYAKPVGNKAVQEAIAGLNFYDLDRVCVIATGGYTKSALDLAKRANVILLSDQEIHLLHDICK